MFATRHSFLKFLLFWCEFIRKASYHFDLSYDGSFSMEKQKWVRISDKQQQQQKLRMNEQVRF